MIGGLCLVRFFCGGHKTVEDVLPSVRRALLINRSFFLNEPYWLSNQGKGFHSTIEGRGLIRVSKERNVFGVSTTLLVW